MFWRKQSGPIPLLVPLPPVKPDGGNENHPPLLLILPQASASPLSRTVNFKLLLVFLVAVVPLSIGVHFLHGYQVRRNASILLDRAEQAHAEGHTEQALHHWYRYLGMAPSDNKVRARYGQVLLEQAVTFEDKFKAYRVLDFVVTREPDRHDIRRHLVPLSMELGLFSDALQHVEALLQRTPENGELEHLAARCEVALKHYPEAAQWYQKTIDHDHQRVEAYLELAYLLRRQLEKPDQADQIMDDLVGANEKSPEAQLARAGYEKEFKRRSGAPYVARALELAPTKPEVLLAAAGLALERENVVQARTHLEEGQKWHPQDVRFYVALARLEMGTDQLPETRKIVASGLKVSPDHRDLLLIHAELLIEGRQHAEAEKVLAKLRPQKALTGYLDFLDARLLMQQGAWSKAIPLLKQAGPQLEFRRDLAVQVQLLLAQCYEQVGAPDLQLVACRQAFTLHPQSPLCRRALASALTSLGRAEEALELFADIAQTGATGQITQIRLLVLQNLGLPPAQRLWKEVEERLKELQAQVPDSVELAIVSAQMLAAQGKADAAEKVLERQRGNHPRSLELWIARADLTANQNDLSLALKILDEAQEKIGDSAPLRLARAHFWARRGGKEAVAEVAGLARNLKAIDARDHARLLDQLAEFLIQLEERKEAERLWNQVVKLQSGDLRCRSRLFHLALLDDDESAMQRLIEQMRSLEGDDGTSWRFHEAERLSHLALKNPEQRSALTRAHTLLDQVARQRPTWAPVPLLEGRIFEIEKEWDKALASYQKAIKLGERSPLVFQRAIKLLYARQRFKEADDLLRQMHQPSALSTDLNRWAAELPLYLLDQERARKATLQAVPADSRDPQELIWRGQMLGALGERAEAEKSFRRAIELGEQLPEPWAALILFLTRSGQKEKADQVLQEARRKLSADKVTALAPCLEAMGRTKQAEEQYLAAHTAQHKDAVALRNLAHFYLRQEQPAKAEPLLRTLLTSEVKISETERDLVRRTLAIALTQGGDYRRFEEALALADDKGKSTSVDDLRTRATVLASRASHRREAVALLEKLQAQHPLLPDDQFLLVQLYEAGRDQDRARSQLLALVAAHGYHPVYVAHLARRLLESRELTRAEDVIDRLESIDPNSWRTTELRARFYHALSNHTRSQEVIQEHLRNPDADQLQAAHWLEILDHPRAAEAIYQARLAKEPSPENLLAMSLFLARQKRTPEALNFCDRLWQNGHLGAAVQASVAVLHQGQASEEQTQRVERLVKTAIDKHPQVLLFRACLAEVREIQNRPAEAELLYREILAKDPREVLTLNNLACQLALRDGKNPEALALIERAIVIEGPAPPLLDSRGVIYLASGKRDLAIRDLEEAISQAPTAVRYFHLAQAHHQGKNHWAANDAWSKAKAARLNPGSLHPLERGAYEELQKVLGRN